MLRNKVRCATLVDMSAPSTHTHTSAWVLDAAKQFTKRGRRRIGQTLAALTKRPFGNGRLCCAHIHYKRARSTPYQRARLQQQPTLWALGTLCYGWFIEINFRLSSRRFILYDFEARLRRKGSDQYNWKYVIELYINCMPLSEFKNAYEQHVKP